MNARKPNSQRRNPNHLRCLTRALKNARHLQKIAPEKFKKGSAAEGFGTGIPMEVLRNLHLLRHDSKVLTRHKPVAAFLREHAIPLPRRASRDALFSGTVYFAQVTFHTNGGDLVIPTADMNTIVQYAQHAAVPISEYASQYGTNSLAISSTLLTYTANVPGASFTDAQLQGWVNDMVTQNSLPTNSCIFVVVPQGITANEVGGNAGYHGFANIPYVVAGVFAQNLTLKDLPDVYAMVVSHEMAEMVVDPKVDGQNPEVCDPCDINCGNLTRMYFDASDDFLGVNQSTPPSGFNFSYYICSVVKPDGAADCPASSADCQYSPVSQNFYFVVDKSTFGRDEVLDNGSYPNAFWLILEGFTPAGVAASVPNLTGAFLTAIPGISITLSSTTYEIGNDPAHANTPQRIRFGYDVAFTSGSLAVFPTAGSAPVQEPLFARLTVQGQLLSFNPETIFELVGGADPYFSNVDPANNNVFYLSQDLRVFSASVGDTPLPGCPAFTSDPYSSIQGLLGFLNSTATYTTPTTGVDPLNSLPGQTGYETGDSSVTPLNSSNGTNYNFALARVRLQDAANAVAPNTRVFFRLFVAQSCDTDFQPATTYKSQLGTSGADNGKPVFPLASGTGLTDPSGQSVQTVPFFATDNNGAHDYDGTNSNANIRDITIPTGQDKVWAYFGCFLDVYNASHQSIFPGTHHCIVAELAYDDAPILNGGGVTESPENCDKLAQRNLQITLSGNPGYPDTHRIPQAFDLRPTPPGNGQSGPLLDYPDELMIDWGNVPAEAVASIYWPQVNAQDVLKLASQFYDTTLLSAADTNTIKCKVTRGVTYIPIPAGVGKNFAGLFTVDLPNTIHSGQEFNIVVRRVSSRRFQQIYIGRAKARNAKRDSENQKITNWRYVTGTFQIKIPVGDDKNLLLPEQNTLAILKWRLQQMSPTYRWYPVLQRYISYISSRVDGFGGNSATIAPSPLGVPTKGKPHGKFGEKRFEKTGKVCALAYDRFGDFEGFVLDTEDGKWRFNAREPEIEKVVGRSWAERILISVFAELDGPHHPEEIVLHCPPRPLHAKEQ